MSALNGKHALVTGGGTGLGAAIASALAAQGAVLTLSGRRRAPLEELAATLPGTVVAQADVSQEESVATMFAAARAAHGPVEILVANAGAVESAPLAKTDLELWQRMLAVNLTGAFLCARGALTDMQAQGAGRIVFVASTAGLKGYPYVASYCAAKHGVVGLARALAQETAKVGITVNAVCPGFAETPLLENSIRVIAEATGRGEAEARRSLLASNPQGRFVQPAEIAQAVLWLCGPGSDAVTGQAIPIAGGEV